MLFHVFAESIGTDQPGGILLGGDDALRRGHLVEERVQLGDVFPLEVMVVGKGQGGDGLGYRRNVFRQLAGRGDAAEQQHVGVAKGVEGSLSAVGAEDGLERLVVYRREVEALVGVEIQGLRDDPVLHGLQVFRTFGDDDDVGPVLSLYRLAQPAGRQQLVVDDKPVVVDE